MQYSTIFFKDVLYTIIHYSIFNTSYLSNLFLGFCYLGIKTYFPYQYDRLVNMCDRKRDFNRKFIRATR